MEKKTLMPTLFLIIFLLTLSNIFATTYTFYTTIDANNLNMTYQSVDYATRSVDGFGSLIYGISPINASATDFYVARFNTTTVLGKPTLALLNRISVNNVTTTCQTQSPCLVKDLSVDQNTGNVYFVVIPRNSGVSAPQVMVANPDLTNVQNIPLNNHTFPNEVSSGCGVFDITVDTSKAYPLVITTGGKDWNCNYGSDTSYFYTITKDGNNRITNATMRKTFDLGILNLYVTAIKMSYTTWSNNYMLLPNIMDDRNNNPHDLYVKLISDDTISSLGATTTNNIAKTPMNTLFFSGTQTNVYRTFFNVSNTYYLAYVSTSNTTLSCVGSQYIGLSCYPDSLGCNCYDTHNICLPNNDLYQGINSSNYLCTNVGISGNNFYCADTNLTYCSGGCTNNILTNTYNVNYTSGICGNSTTCTNDCNVEGLTYSDTYTSYKQCGFNPPSDGCLHWSSSIPCAVGEYSINGFCSTLNTSGFTAYTLTNFVATPDTLTASSINPSQNPPNVNYNTQNVFKTVGVDYMSTPTSFYIAKNCNYSETNILNDQNIYNVNNSTSITFNSYINGNTVIHFLLPENGSMQINMLDAINNNIMTYNISHDDTLGVCLHDNTSLLGCSIVSYSDIKNIDFTIATIRPNTNYLVATKTTIHRFSGNDKNIYTGFTNVLFNSNYNKINFVTNNATIQGIIINNTAQVLEPWKNMTWTQHNNDGSILYQQSCVYSNVGCFTLRSYYSDALTLGYWNYKDLNVCINALSGQLINTGENKSLLDSLSPLWKMILGLLVPLIVFAFCAIMGYMGGMPQIGLIMGTIFGIGALIAGVMLGWVDVWVLLLMVAITGVASVIMYRVFLNGGGGAN